MIYGMNKTMLRKIIIAAIMLSSVMRLRGETGADFTDPRYGIEMTYVQGGTFIM